MSDPSERLPIWQQWNEGGGPKYPNDQVVRFVFRRFPADQRRGLRVLDLGCGGGVHTVFLAREGCRVTGVDLAPIGIENTRKKLEAEKLDATLLAKSADAIDFPEGSFRVVICVGVLESAGIAVAREAVRRATNALEKGGVGFFLFASERDARIHGPNEYGLHGYTRKEVEDVFSVPGLANVDIDRINVTFNGGKSELDDWNVTLEK